MSTFYARGTPSYRAPKLLEERPTFTKMVDIWSLGCVLHELATSRLAFSGDYSVLKYYDNAEKFTDIQLDSSSTFLRHHVSEGICDLLQRDPGRRPRASVVRGICSAYVQILDVSEMRHLIESQPYPHYFEWKELIEKCPSEPEWLFSVAEIYEKNGQEELGIGLYKEIVRRYLRVAKSRFDIGDRSGVEDNENVMYRLGHKLVKKRLYEEAITVYEAILEQDSGRISIIERLAKCYVANGNHEEALRTYEICIQKDPICFSAWYGLCKVYLSMGNLDNAITKLSEDILKYPGVPSPTMLLCNLYSTEGDYKNAVLTYMKAWERCGSQFRYVHLRFHF